MKLWRHRTVCGEERLNERDHLSGECRATGKSHLVGEARAPFLTCPAVPGGKRSEIEQSFLHVLHVPHLLVLASESGDRWLDALGAYDRRV